MASVTRCQEPDTHCPRDAVGTDIQDLWLCREHLAFSMEIQRMCNNALDAMGHPELVPDEYRLERNN